MDMAAHAILSMQVRGAPCIGATAAYGMALAMRADPSDTNLEFAAKHLEKQRPTAVNLRWAVDQMCRVLRPAAPSDRAAIAYARAAEICDDDVEICRKIGGARSRDHQGHRGPQGAPASR
jgi:methylthioribose-1-phosphate isomerase